MGDIVRMSISRFKATAKGGMELPVIVTVDGEDVFAVVEVSRLGDFTTAWHGGVSVDGQVERIWVPPDLARDT